MTLREKSGHLAWCALVALALAQENLFLTRWLASKLNYLWRSCTGELSEQNDLFRLTYALETAKDMDWSCCLLSDRGHAVTLKPGVNGIYLSRTNLDVAFNDSGQQINPLTARLSGNVAGLVKLFNRCGWQAEPEGDASLPCQFTLTARQGGPEKYN